MTGSPKPPQISPGPVAPSIPSLSAIQMREVDRLMVDEYGISVVQMMENAGRNLAHLARERSLGAGENLIRPESDAGGDRED